MDAPRAGGLGQAVVGVIEVVGEVFLPPADEGGRHRLGADVHELPLVQLVIRQLHVPPVQSVQDLLGPGHQEPDQGTPFVGNGPEDDLRGGALQQHRLAPGPEAPHPVEFGPGVVEGRDAQEHVVVADAVVLGLHFRGLGEAQMLM